MMTTQPHRIDSEPTYDELVTKYHEVIALRQRFEAKLKTLTPGSTEGYLCFQQLERIERAEDKFRAVVRNHADAPPAG